MKHHYFFSFMLIATMTLAQVDYNQIIVSNYVEFATLDYDEEQYLLDEDGSFITFELHPEEDYYIFDNGEEKIKNWWEYSGEEEGTDDYYSEAGEKIVFDYEEQTIWFYYDLNETTNFYESLMALSKLESFEKENNRTDGEYVPQSIRK